MSGVPIDRKGGRSSRGRLKVSTFAYPLLQIPAFSFRVFFGDPGFSRKIHSFLVEGRHRALKKCGYLEQGVS